MADSKIQDSLTLPCGAILPNRIAKSAMSENLVARNGGNPDPGLIRLYQRWGRSGAGLLITGNVMVDRNELGEPGNVIADGSARRAGFRDWARAAQDAGSRLWMQINHPGRQSPIPISRVTYSASDVRLRTGQMFRKPTPMSESEIRRTIDGFAFAAALAREAGFHGVQIHGAHGYLVSQFLSPLTNLRTDEWGGTAEKRRKFVLEVFRAMRKSTAADFPIGIKLNSADFQRGGFEESESLDVCRALAGEGVDLLEISGGTYEKAAMTGAGMKESTREREAYFLEFAEKVRQAIPTPLMLTGGFRSVDGMNAALSGGAVDVIGLARPMALEPDLPRKLLDGSVRSSSIRPVRTGLKMIDASGALELGWYALQLERMAEGKDPDPELSPLLALGKLGLKYTDGVLSRITSGA